MTDSMDARTLRRVNSCLNKMANERKNAEKSAARLRGLGEELQAIWPDTRAATVVAGADAIAAILRCLP